MRTIRTLDPQSGITTVREITLISTAGVTSNEYEELPEANHDVQNMGNQLTEAIYDTRKSINSGNSMVYQLMLNLTREMSKSGAKQADAITELRSMLDNYSEVQYQMESSAREVQNETLSEISSEIKTLRETQQDSTVNNENLNEIGQSADNMTVTIGGETMSVNHAFTEIFNLLTEINTRLTQLTS